MSARTITTVRLEGDTGVPPAEDLLSASLLDTEDALESLSQNMHEYHVTTRKNGGKNQTSFEIIIFTKKKKKKKITFRSNVK